MTDDPTRPTPEEATLPFGRTPTFDAPWQARAFGVAVVLSDHREGCYSWDEFRKHLAEEIQRNGNDEKAARSLPNAGSSESESEYYERWLEALERVALSEGLIDSEAIRHRVDEFATGERDASEFVDGEHDHTHPHVEGHDHHHEHSHEGDGESRNDHDHDGNS